MDRDTAQPDERRRTILVVDDDPETATVIRTWLAGRPFDVRSARDGRTGVEIARETRPDLILLDLRMPGMDGLEVARELVANPATRVIPFIMLTACRRVEDKVAAFSAGAHDYVTKPFEFEEIEARMDTCLRRRDQLVGLESRVDQLNTTNSELEWLLTLDEKTGLHNFREFRRKLIDEWARAERYGVPLSLVMLDIDRFKLLNDTFGHPAGDQVLRELATLVAGGARVTDTAARYGGEEFAVILPHTDNAMAVRVAERIRAAVAEFDFVVEGHTHRITVSAGVASYPESRSADSVDMLVYAADQALYAAKREGRNRVARAPFASEDEKKTVDRRRRADGSDRRSGSPAVEVDVPDRD